MQTQPTVSFDDIPSDEAVRDAAYEQIAELEDCFDRITGCHVVVAQPHRHHREGRLYSVRIELLVPGVEIVVNRNHPLEHAHEDIFVALRDAFLAARRRLEEHVQLLRGEGKSHTPQAAGHVAKLFPLEGYGFIETTDGREVYFHRHAIGDQEFRRLDIGSRVHFREELGDEGPQAVFVHLARGPGRAISRNEAGPAAPEQA